MFTGKINNEVKCADWTEKLTRSTDDLKQFTVSQNEEVMTQLKHITIQTHLFSSELTVCSGGRKLSLFSFVKRM